MIHYTIAEENTSPVFVTLEQAKTHLRVDHTYEDTLIQGLIAAAITACEDYTGRLFGHHIIHLHSDQFPKRTALEYGPLRTMDIGISYYDLQNTPQDYDSGNYRIITAYGKPPELIFTGAESPPKVYSRHDAVRVSFQVGYQEQLPTPVYQAVLLTLSDFYQYREDRKAITATRAMSLLRPYKKWV
ncbi:MAG: head-tail connector protein [Bacteroidota bacterium]